MIKIKTKQEITKMKKAGKMAFRLLELIEHYIKPGISTNELNCISEDWIKSHNLVSATLNYRGFPKSICTSLNNVVCHGIPKNEDVLKSGDIINIDVTVILNGYHGDTSKTFIVDETDLESQYLVSRTEKAMYKGIETVKAGSYLTDIGLAIDDYITPFGYGIVQELGGHGIGKKFHESPFVYHHNQKRRATKLKAGMIFTIEPMINQGDPEIFIDEVDGWTVYTEDFTKSSQFEHTVLVTNKGYELMTVDG